MTSLDEVASHFTEPAEVDEGLVAEILGSAAVLQDMAEIAEVVFPAPFDPTFQCGLLRQLAGDAAAPTRFRA